MSTYEIGLLGDVTAADRDILVAAITMGQYDHGTRGSPELADADAAWLLGE